ncbi:FecR family protein [Pseudobacter ginsenosidimutans]|uniref:FecR family protein n=1 Tax=Pseudobacter ginsenosidimutans TaxID=661488 RepID=A0A4Q7N2N5_9BACT|nr:FecR family protein [Pseudobacter ginsenosidimutans]QEC42975.1 DUF4974 domain-containing protein [Pseudobacter ginsenosidimutans]RZS74325.1 FecR family protein [Pseudobacter ginsenosidimutans]
MTNRALLEKMANNSASEADINLFWERLKHLPQQEVADLMDQYESMLEQEADFGAADEQMFREMQQRIATWETPAKVHSFRANLWRNAAVAASLLILLAIGGYFWLRHKDPPAIVGTNPKLSPEIGPGRDGAILTLADGRKVLLDSMGDGNIAIQNGARIELQNGRLAYHPDGRGAENIGYNTMTTPKGRQYSLLLPDGSRVWLNAASSLRFPTTFSGKQRRVEITGEAFFEVAPNASQPFQVNIANQAGVEVLGTSFNVNAYTNEPVIDLTLLEGTVKVSPASKDQMMEQQDRTGKAVVLKPGQQARLFTGQQTPAMKVIDDADMDKVMAWKNGLFNFNGLSFGEIMRQLERWYDIKVVYENNTVPNKRLAGEMTRGVSLNGLLKQLGEMGVRYQLNDRTLLILQ